MMGSYWEKMEMSEIRPRVLDGKVALVTGAGQGIGKAVALRLARDGAAVVAADVKLDAAQQTAEEVSALGGAAMAVAVDVRDVEQIQAMVDATVERFGRIDILVPCAGITQIKKMQELSVEEWDRMFAVNTRGLFFTIQRAAEAMIRQGGGAIVTVASVAGLGPRPFFVHYAASKAAVISITRSAAAMLAPHDIKVNTVCPGIVGTAMWDQIDEEMAREFGESLGQYRRQRLAGIPLGRFQTAEDVANTVAFLASPEAGNITGQSLNVDGGLHMS
jgi:meso-butanediol dehydrogenase / (S,S)-butanediol dehydrogenase / diacetyl reductase